MADQLIFRGTMRGHTDRLTSIDSPIDKTDMIVSSSRDNSLIFVSGLALYVAALLVVPFMDVWYVKGRVGINDGYIVTVLVALCGIADALVQGGIMGNAGELPEQYMQAVVAGTAASGKYS